MRHPGALIATNDSLGIPQAADGTSTRSSVHAGVIDAIGRASLKLQLCFLVTAMIAALTIAGGGYIVWRAQRDIQSEVRSAVNLAEHYLDTQLGSARAEAGQAGWPADSLQLRGLRELRHIRVIYYDAAGHRVDASASDESDDDKSPAWFEWLVRRSLPPLAEYRRDLSFDGADAGYVVVKPDPSDEIAEIWNVSSGLLRLLVVFLLVVNGLIWWAVGRALKPLLLISSALGDIGRGKLQARLPALELAELSRLSGDFNQMAARLESSVAENEILTRRLIATQDDERKRIARELHDEIGQCVTAIHADAVAIQQSPDALNREVQASASAIVQVTGSIKDMVRGMLQRLRPAAVEGLGLEESLRYLLSAFQQRNSAWITALSVSPDAHRVDADISMAAYRLVQEALTNIARHAAATHVAIEAGISGDARRGGSVLTVRIHDDGRGFDPAGISGRFGLLGMRERIHDLDGTLRVDSQPGQGTQILAKLPLKE